MPRSEYDAIVVLGGDLNAEGELTPRNYPRLNLAIKLFHSQLAPRLIMAGGRQLFPAETGVSEDALSNLSEAGPMKEYAVINQVPADAIKTDDSALETVGNALAVKKNFLLPNVWARAIVVTSRSHAPRCRRVFEHVMGDDFEIDVAAAPERFREVQRARNMWGVLTTHYVLSGVQRGDHEAIADRLRERVPGYGGEITRSQHRVNSLLDFLLRPPLNVSPTQMGVGSLNNLAGARAIDPVSKINA